MSIYVIGDLHLSLGCNKPMDVFGGRWDGYVEKIKEGFQIVSESDTTVICGDLTWGMDLEEAKEDFLFIDRLPGKKIILKGNHDYWWSTAAKAQNFFDQNGIHTIEILHNNCFIREGIAICGTRGWPFDDEHASDPVHDRKILNRELSRLESSLKLAGETDKHVFLHYPPKLMNYECKDILNLLSLYNVKHCWYGHLHSNGRGVAFEGEYCGINFRLISADHLHFIPLKVI